VALGRGRGGDGAVAKAGQGRTHTQEARPLQLRSTGNPSYLSRSDRPPQRHAESPAPEEEQ